MKEAGWEEGIVVIEAAWLLFLLIWGEGRDGSCCFQLFWGIKKTPNIWVFHVEVVHTFPVVGFCVVVAFSTARFPDWLMFNTFISQGYHLDRFNLMQIFWLVLGNLDVLCSWAHLRVLYAGWQMHAQEVCFFCNWWNLGENQLFPRTFVYLNLAASILFLSVSSLPTKLVSRDIIF